MFRKITTIAVLAFAISSISVGSVLADAGPPSLPAPGVLGLIAFGVIGAIGLAKSRK